MKLNELIIDFTIAVTNEEKAILERMDRPSPMTNFTAREQTIINNLIRKSLVSKVLSKGNVWVIKNEA